MLNIFAYLDSTRSRASADRRLYHCRKWRRSIRRAMKWPLAVIVVGLISAIVILLARTYGGGSTATAYLASHVIITIIATLVFVGQAVIVRRLGGYEKKILAEIASSEAGKKY